MRAYYSEAGIEIFHADCRDILPSLPKVDLVLTDPPYGVDLGSRRPNSEIKRQRGPYLSTDDTPEFVTNIVVPVISQCIERFGRVVVTPGNRCMWLYPPPSEFGCVFHPAGNGICRWGFNMAHPILYYGKDPKMPNAYANGMISTATAEDNGHPCPKPLSWVRWLIKRCSLDGETILDPFMGSGTTLVAAKALGRKAIGIEIEERYCQIAVDRLRQQVLDFQEKPEEIVESFSPLFEMSK